MKNNFLKQLNVSNNFCLQGLNYSSGIIFLIKHKIIIVYSKKPDGKCNLNNIQGFSFEAESQQLLFWKRRFHCSAFPRERK